ncbi:hypothetical protein EZS27_005350 [termite gut metagenome]|uniref:Uncharacterized protein n=1 Tax=termite gut metagenome TaxID=433724 RepID=A0A5J4SNZ8_9ZZZZ
MSYSEVTKQLENEGWEKTFFDLVSAADHYSEEADRLEMEYKKALANRGTAASNLEYLILAMVQRDNLRELIEVKPGHTVLRVVARDTLYIVEIILKDDGRDKLIKWKRRPVAIIQNS